MTPLAAELLRILQAEGDHPPLKAESLANILRCAVGLEPTPDELQQALDTLLLDGRIEAVWSHRIGRRFSVMRDRGDMSEPGAA